VHVGRGHVRRDKRAFLITETRLPVKRVSQRCGFGSEETMRRSFLRLLCVTPQDYRDRFKF
jgi:transcriptional regulator GlxA family with amidase domain